MLCGALALCVAPAGVWAQRQPVLRQIREPHSYYFREMYLAQLTSGPSAATWSPDGSELIYSMQGSLWRQRVGTGEARQLTDGPGYDYQPDWSPDGRTVVFSSYRNDAVELHLLDLATGATRPLLADGAVNVEPRWSPDGHRIAWVSTAYEGRFHVFVAPVSNGALGTAERITEDRDSGLPRYYYSRYDQYLSPTWSPDGRELIVLSNRGHIWGSGGFWRTEARSGALMRELRFEETTWRARPDWSPDGKRILYSSYLGRQWHQLWLMTAEGENPVQLTYGEYDATSPRWSRDGRRIAFISNEAGNTGLWVLGIPGAARIPVRAERRLALHPMGHLLLQLRDAATGRPVAARVAVTSGDGRAWAPDDAWRYADDAFNRSERKFEMQYFHTDGSAEIAVPPGEVRVEVTRGLEFVPAVRTVVATGGKATLLTISLRRIADLPSLGWYSGDLHVHMNYGGTYRNSPPHLVRQALAEDLHVVENLIVNKEGRIPDVDFFPGVPDPASRPGTLLVHDQEFHTSLWAHTGLLGLKSHLLLPGYAGYAGTPVASPAPTNAEVFELAHSQGALTGYVHPFDFDPDPADTSRALTHEFPVEVGLGTVDYFEALGFADDYWATLKVWYRALNCGFRLPAGAGTDAMANFASLRGHVGMDRVFVQLRGPLTHRSFLDGLKAGRSFATNGPLVRLSIEGKGPGDELRLPAPRTVRATVWLRSIVPIDHLEVVSNGEVIANVPLTGDRKAADATIELPVRGSAWFTLRAWSDGPRHPVLDAFPLGTTSPIYATVAGAAIRSASDANYFASWIRRLEAAAESLTSWNSQAERAESLRRFVAAREEFERRAR